jgi:hypothetical protein
MLFDSRLSPQPFVREELLPLPSNLRGVYGIFNYTEGFPLLSVPPSFTPLYVGSSTNDVRGRLLSHLNGTGAPLLWLYLNTSTQFVVEHYPPGGLGSLLALTNREAELIEYYRPLCNTQGIGQTPPDLLGSCLRLLGLIPS